jgi:DNA segregation ATPase FtsK/SpoIIIE, S-DNA-T family
LIYNCTPQDVKLVLIDPLRVEFSFYNNLKHLQHPIIYDIGEAEKVLKKLVDEMEERINIIYQNGCRDIIALRKKGVKLHSVVVFIDEFQNITLSKDHPNANGYIQTLASQARKAGIHLIVATQKPSAKVIDTAIKANFPTRIAFKVSSHDDSITILDTTGAEKLNGKGDMLLWDEDGLQRIQGAFISEEEIEGNVSENISYRQRENIFGIVKEYIPPSKLEREQRFKTYLLGNAVEADYEEVDTEDKNYKYFYRAALYCIEQNKCNQWAVKMFLKKGNRIADEIIDKMQNEKIIGLEKIGNDFEILMSLNDFKQKYKEG